MNLFLKDTQNSINCIDNQNLIRTFYLKLRACLPYRLRLCCCFCLSYSRFCLWAVDFRAHFHWILEIFRSISCVQSFHVREDDPQFHFTSELIMLFPLQNKYSWNIHSLIYFLLKNMKMSKSSTTHTFTLILTVQFNRTIKLVKYLEQTQINTFAPLCSSSFKHIPHSDKCISVWTCWCAFLWFAVWKVVCWSKWILHIWFRHSKNTDSDPW